MWCRDSRGTRNCVCVGLYNKADRRFIAPSTATSVKLSTTCTQLRSLLLNQAPHAKPTSTVISGPSILVLITSIQGSFFNKFGAHQESDKNRERQFYCRVNWNAGILPLWIRHQFRSSCQDLRLIYGAIYVDVPVDTAGIRDPVPFQSEDLLFL